ncbi:MAG TPA: (2Fe-2S)-binding protein [Casimicrobiaceae bacterium]|nr:(2Fe-2S)-binding protein [Casimicrobiaceae bacterium]
MIRFELNGREVAFDGDADAPLLDALRNTFNLKGTRFGCGLEQCGACNVLVEGKAIASCTLPTASVQDKRVTTIEGLGTPETPHPLQQAFLDEQAAQCGYCTSGMIISAAALLLRTPSPGSEEIKAALDGNLCRCGSHNRIVRAVQRAVSSR